LDGGELTGDETAVVVYTMDRLLKEHKPATFRPHFNRIRDGKVLEMGKPKYFLQNSD